jgi:hypothetical protein
MNDIQQIRNSAILIRNSPLKWNKVKEKCVELGIQPKKIQLDSPTRWNGIFDLLKSMRHLWKAFTSCACEGIFDDTENESLMIFTHPGIPERLKKYLLLLKVFAKASQELEGEKYVTLSLVPIHCHSMLKALEIDNLNDPIYLIQFKQALCVEYKTRLSFVLEKRNLSLSAAVLDVRTCIHVKKIISPLLYDEIWSNIVQECICAASESDKLEFEIAAFQSFCNSIRTQLESIPINSDSMLLDPLEWWAKKTKYSILHNGVKMILSTPASSAPSERVFSASGNIATNSRNRMNNELLEQTTILRSYLLRQKMTDLIDFRNLAISIMSSLKEEIALLEKDYISSEDDFENDLFISD